MPTLNRLESIRSTRGKISLLLCGLAATVIVFEVLRSQLHGAVWLSALEAIVIGGYIAGGTLAAVGIARKAVVEAEERYREVVERSAEGFYQSTPEGNLLAANDALARMFGYERAADILAEPPGIVKRLYASPARREEYLRQIVAHGSITGFESALRRRDGLVFWASQSARLVRDSSGEPKYFEGFLVDITARKHAEQLRADFVGFVTHQLRTPLAGIRWMIELARGEQVDPTVDSYLADAHVSTQRLIALVNDLLDITRLESGRAPLNPTTFKLRQPLSDVIAELAHLADAKEQRISVSGDLAVATYADPRLTRQAVLNLVSNAIKYTPHGGLVAIELRAHAGQVQCAVRDTGIGIPRAAQGRLFEKFFRAENAVAVDTEGTGLGLYLTKLIAERSGGSISCESIERQGSTFVLSLPAGTS